MNYANISWASTYKSKLEGLYCHQKHAARLINSKYKFTHAQLLLHDMKALKIFQTNLFRIIYFNFKCKEKIASPIFHSLFTPKPEISTILDQEEKLTEPFNGKNGPSLTLTIVVHIYGMNSLMRILLSLIH